MLGLGIAVSWSGVVLLGLAVLNPSVVRLPTDFGLSPILIAGGIVLGLGSAMNGGCFVGSIVRAGSGNLNFPATLLGLSLGMHWVDGSATPLGEVALPAAGTATRAIAWSAFLVIGTAAILAVIRRRELRGVAWIKRWPRAFALSAAGMLAGLMFARNPDWSYAVAIDQLSHAAGRTVDWPGLTAPVALFIGALLGARVSGRVPTALAGAGAGPELPGWRRDDGHGRQDDSRRQPHPAALVDPGDHRLRCRRLRRHDGNNCSHNLGNASMIHYVHRVRLTAVILIASLAPDARADTPADGCGRSGDLAVQVLGSGGPELTAGRASTSYLVWHDGRARVLVDFGSGAMLRYGQSGARLEDLEFLALSHLHVDHSADVAALVKSGYFSSRSAPLRVVGPGSGSVFPGLVEWLNALLAPHKGAFRYLSGALDGSGGQFPLVSTEIPVRPDQISIVIDRPDLRIEALPVPHGVVPALAYRIRIDDRVIVFGGDQNGQSDRFWEFARGADLLVAHLALPEEAGGAARALHAPPSRIGEGAARAGVRHLVLSHFMTRSEAALDANVEIVRRAYGGPVTLAADLHCTGVIK